MADATAGTDVLSEGRPASTAGPKRSVHSDAASTVHSPNDPVAAALASGLWKEKKDPKSGKAYFVNTKTKKATWNLAKELGREGVGTPPPAGPGLRPSGRGKSDEEMREERHQRARQRVEAEVALASQIAQLEQSKVELEADVARLKAPVEAEAAKLAELRQIVADKRYTIDAVHREALQRRQARDAELRSIMVNVTNLQSVVDSDAAFKESVDARHRQLLVESMELSSDLDKERAAAEALQAAVREAELSLGLATEELRQQEAEILRKEQLVRLAETDLAAVARQKSEAEDAIKELEAERGRLQDKAKKAARIAQAAAEQAAKIGSASVAQLTEQYQSKVRTLETLSKLEAREDDAMMLEHANGKLRTLIASAQKDRTALARLSQLLETETKRVLNVVAVMHSEATLVAKTLAEMELANPKTREQLRAGSE
jgi:chromosome segregation ATPase